MTPALVARVTDSAPVLICAWCPDFDPRDPINKGASHVLCAACAAKIHAELDAEEPTR